jgi:hypothetical protein
MGVTVKKARLIGKEAPTGCRFIDSLLQQINFILFFHNIPP